MHGLHYHILKEYHDREVVDWERWLGQWFVPLSQFWKKYFVPAAKRIGRDLFETGASEVGNVISGKTNIKKAVKRTARETIRKQIESGKKFKKKKRKPVKIKKKIENSRTDFFRNIKE